MTERLTRANQVDLTIRSDGRTVCGIAVPFGVPAPIVDFQGRYTETWQRGAFSRTIADRPGRVKFMALHERRALPLGRATVLREDAAGLYFEGRVSKTVAGDEVLELVRDGALDGLSIGAEVLRDQWSPDRRSCTRLEAKLTEISCCPFPAFDSARIAAVRSHHSPLTVELARAQLDLLERTLS